MRSPFSAGGPRNIAGALALICLWGVADLSARQSPSRRPEQRSKHADLILYQGKIWTVDQRQPLAQAVAVRGSRIIKVGSNQEVLALKGEHTRSIDLHGRLVLPGFNDAHTHFGNAVEWFFEVLLMEVNEPREFLRRLQEAVERVPKGLWITGTDWGAFAAWAAEKKGDRSFRPFTPELARVDAVSPDHPVLLRRYDHAYFANSRALGLAGITEQTRDPQGGRYERDPSSGKLTGMLYGTAGEQIEKLRPPFTEAQKLVGARGVLRELNRRGITSIHDISRLDAISQSHVFPTFVERSYTDVNIFRDLRTANELTVRVYAFMPLQVWKDLRSFGIVPESGDEMIRYGILKDFIDGTLMFAPYASDAHNSGNFTFRFPGEEVMARNILEADRAGFDIGIHVVGDKALHFLLDWYEAAITKNGSRDRRFRLIHAWFATPEDLERAGRLRLIADVTPGQLLNDTGSIERIAGPERAKTAFAWRTMINDGVRLDLVSDLPGSFNKQSVAWFNPLENIYCAIRRKDAAGNPQAGWHPEQCLTLQEAIEAYTANPAFASHEENLKGTISAGKLADLVVLSKDILSEPPEQIRSTEVLYTILGGKMIFENNHLLAGHQPPGRRLLP